MSSSLSQAPSSRRKCPWVSCLQLPCVIAWRPPVCICGLSVVIAFIYAYFIPKAG